MTSLPVVDAPFKKDPSAPFGFASFRYTERGFDTQAVKVLPGEFYVDSKDTPIVTILGSCVAVCLRDAAVQVGGMNHFLLPDGGESGIAGTAGRYGVNAMEMLINELVKRGAQRSRLEAKIFSTLRELGCFQKTCWMCILGRSVFCRNRGERLSRNSL
jgi:hypothetical protein